MATNWSREEVEATVADYFAMLEKELRDFPYDKSEHRRHLMPLLRGRSAGSVEFKHQNISAVLIRLGFPYIAGYKPRFNFQRLLYEVVSERLAASPALVSLAEIDVEQTIAVPEVEDILRVLTAPPKSALPKGRAHEPIPPYFPLPVNYLERESRNRRLGLAGEQFVINFERARLIYSGREVLASKIEHVAKSRGDAEGFDVLSFETSGAERLIEVKTTRYGKETPFFVSRNEVRVSESHEERYHLYRLFTFQRAPQLFTLKGALASICRLEPSTYVAMVA